MKTVDEEILELLADDQPRSCLDIEEDILRDQNKIRPALQRLVNAGQIIRVKQPKAMIYMSIAASEKKTEKLQELIVSYLTGNPMSYKHVAIKVHMHEVHVKMILEEMADKGIIQRNKTSRFTSYYVPEPEAEDLPIVAPQYHPPFRELGKHDLAAFKTLCEGARNVLTGVV